MHDTSFVMADIAGIIEGAHKGLGLGLKFLKHIERTKVLIHVVDVSGSEGRDPIEDFDKINDELRRYSEVVAGKPMIVAANKIDLTDENGEEYAAFKSYVEAAGYPVYPISAPIKYGVAELLDAALLALNEAENEASAEPEVEYWRRRRAQRWLRPGAPPRAGRREYQRRPARRDAGGVPGQGS